MRALRIASALVIGVVGFSPAPAATSYAKFAYERHLVPMRDDVRLSVDIWRPLNADGSTVRPIPVILTLTPYHALYKALDRNETDLPSYYPGIGQWVNRGYAVALADVRGTYNSGGCWDYGGRKEREDGYDLVEWLAGFAADGSPSAAAGWSNGRVAMIGASYDGTTANAAAVEAPPHLATIVPVAAISRWWGYAYQQGTRSTYSGESVDIDPPSDTPADFMLAYGFAPPPDHDRVLSQPTQVAMRWNLCDRVEKALRGYETEPVYDDFWVERDYLRLAGRVAAPALVVHGMLDFNVKTWEGTAWFEALPGTKVLVAGQWPHATPDGRYPGWSTFLRRWFDRWLRDDPNGIEFEAAVRVQSNAGTWREDAAWGEGARVAFPLEGRATIVDDGALTESEMLRGIANPMGTRYIRVPVPGSPGVRFEGMPVLELRARSDQPSTHLVAVLCDVDASGACTVVSRAFLNARFDASLSDPADLVPGEWRTFRLEFIDKEWEVAPGNRLELIVASSSTTWVTSDERRAVNELDLAASRLVLPLR